MNPLKVNFQELYERHLCRHSQYGINVIHVAAVFGIYLALAGIICSLAGTEWVLLGIIILHLAIVALNVPARVLLGTVLFMAGFFAVCLTLPRQPWWVSVYLLAIPLLYKIQAWSHKIYNVERDITEFNKKYKKGFVLFVLLSIYELPLLLKYLVFDKNNWPVWVSRPRIEAPPAQPGASPES
ncbi:MAG TPA: hypothetical protein VMG10_00505 [Gemmataceae bacterium]|nr:hypothetical protein [Gemmataceae bacterium]